MLYEEIYSRFYTKEIDQNFFKKYSKDEAYELMKNWLHTAASFPYVKKCFSSINLDDEILTLDFTLKISINKDSDEDFVKDLFAQGIKICWMQQKIDTAINLSAVVGAKEEKTILNNYKYNISRLNDLEIKLKKFIRDYCYYNESIGE